MSVSGREPLPQSARGTGWGSPPPCAWPVSATVPPITMAAASTVTARRVRARVRLVPVISLAPCPVNAAATAGLPSAHVAGDVRQPRGRLLEPGHQLGHHVG